MKEIKISGNIRNVTPILAGENHMPVIIASIGATNMEDSLELELLKAVRAVAAGAMIVTDHTLLSNMEYIHQKIADKITIPFSAISVYEAAVKAKVKSGKIDAQDMIKIVENQAKRGIDVLTLHATAFRDDINLLEKSNRLIPCTSRGGTMMLEILKETGQENPYWTYFEDVLDIADKYRLTISLGTCFRPASVYDCAQNNDLYYMEIERMSKLIEKADKRSVGVIVEGIGHAPLNQIEGIVKNTKKICKNVPYRVLTVATDIALGYDHISSAIASANAVYYGADMVTCVSRSEHIGLPSIDDLEEAVVSAKIAAYAGYSARNNDFSRDKLMSEARNSVGCQGQIEAAIYPEGAKKAIIKRKIIDGKKECGMCGEFCALDANERLLVK